STAGASVEFNQEALVARGMACREKGRDPRGDLGVAVGELPVDPRIIEVDTEHRAALGEDRVAQRGLQLPSLDVDRHAPREVPEAARMVVVEVADRHGDDVTRIRTNQGEGVFQRGAGRGELDRRGSRAPETRGEAAT